MKRQEFAAVQRQEYATARQRMARLSIPALIEQLSSEDVRTRFLAEMCLRDATNT